MEQHDASGAQHPAALNFQRFLDLMNQDAAKDLVRSINTFMKDFKSRSANAQVDSRHCQAFLQHMEAAMAKHPLWANSTPQELDGATEALEKYLMTKLHDRTFGCSPEDAERDELLATRMAALQFVRTEHLEIPTALVDGAALATATKELNKMNAYRAPRDKLVCILNCCRVVSNLLTVASKSGGAAGADDFTPLLIYVVIRARTPMLASNLSYIERFRMASKLTGESHYYYIQLCGAATFIEMINATSLKVNADEFISHMLAHGAMTEEQLALMQRSDSGQRTASDANGPNNTMDIGSVETLGVSPAAVHTQSPLPGGGAELLNARQDAGSSMPRAEPATTQQPVASQTAAHAGRAATDMSPAAGQRGRSFLLPLSLAELEAQGAALLAQAASSSSLAVRHPFAFTPLERLTIGDVPRLLEAYKDLVIKYEVLAGALRWHQQQHDNPESFAQASVKAGAAENDAPTPSRGVQPAPSSHTTPSAPSPAVQATQLPVATNGSQRLLQEATKTADVVAGQRVPSEHMPPAGSEGIAALQGVATTATKMAASMTANASTTESHILDTLGTAEVVLPERAAYEDVGTLPQDQALGPTMSAAAVLPAAEEQPMFVGEAPATTPVAGAAATTAPVPELEDFCDSALPAATAAATTAPVQELEDFCDSALPAATAAATTAPVQELEDCCDSALPAATAAATTAPVQELEDFCDSALPAATLQHQGVCSIPAASSWAEGGASTPSAQEDLLGDLLCNEPSSESTATCTVPAIHTGPSQPFAHETSLLD